MRTTKAQISSETDIPMEKSESWGRGWAGGKFVGDNARVVLRDNEGGGLVV